MKNYLENYGVGEFIIMVLLRFSLIAAVSVIVLGYYGICADDGFAWAGGLGIIFGFVDAFALGWVLFKEMKEKIFEK